MTDDEIRAALGDLQWSIGREGRNWAQAEMLAKLDRLPAKFEVMEPGKLFWDEAERIRVAAAVMEHLGLDLTLRVAAVAAETRPQANSTSTASATVGWVSQVGKASPDFGEELLHERSEVKRTWNYRAIRFELGDDSYTAIHEVHYEADKPVAYSANEAVVMWTDDDQRGGHTVLERMRLALDKPALSPSDFDSGEG